MRTKALILTAVLGVAMVANSLAQVYSVNAVGYVNKTIPAGLSMIANPLSAPDNTLGALIPNAPIGCNFYKFNGTSFDIATFIGVWDLATLTLAPGEGGFINTTDPFTNTFVGDVMQSVGGVALKNPIPAGLSIRASMVPQAGGVDVLGLTTLTVGDNLYKWNVGVQSYVIYTYLGGGIWDPLTPQLDIAESVFLNAALATSWDRVFTVNP